MAATKPRTSKIGWFGRHKIISVVLLVTVLVAGYFVYEKIAYQMNKHAFAEAKSSIDAVYADIVSKVGPPDDKNQIIQQCNSRTTSISCSLAKDFIYSESNIDAANRRREKIQNVIAGDSNKFEAITAPPNQQILTTLQRDHNLPVANYYKAGNGVFCFVDYFYNPTFNTELVLKIRNSNSIFIEIQCSGKARGFYYN
jgi:hypothetical protein